MPHSIVPKPKRKQDNGRRGRRLAGVMFCLLISAWAFPRNGQAYSYSGHHWDFGNPRYVDVYIKSSVLSAWIPAIARSMSTWNQTTSKFRFRASGSANHNIGFRNVWEYPNALAVTYIREGNGSTRITDRDTDISSRYSWDVNGVAGKYDIQNVMTHEFGHWLTLNDLYNGADFWKTMYGYANPGETYKRTLDTDDINGIRRIYGI